MGWSYGASYGKGRMYWLTHIYESARIRHPRQAEQKRAPIIVQLWRFRAIWSAFATSWAKNLRYFCSARAILSRHHLLNMTFWISNDNPCRKIGLFLCGDLKHPLKNILLGPKQQSLQKNHRIFLQGLLLSELPELPELSELSTAIRTFCSNQSFLQQSELSTAIRAFCSNQPICYLSTHYVICLPHPDSRHITQTADYLRISKPPLIDILETWIFRRLEYSGNLDIQEA